MNSIRCFIALELPLPVQRHLAGIISRLKTTFADVKWVDPQNTHLTLKFLGEISPEQAKRAGEFMASQRGRRWAINCSTSQIGVFPGWSRPQVIWLGLSDEGRKISALQKTLEEGLAGCGFARDPKKFKPHLTLGRVRSLIDTGQLAEKIKTGPLEEIEFNFGELALIKSTLTSGGPVYQTLVTIELT
jgi:RNA 2',3'-cyclic 3'-phosphodiesterase